jgi:enoyl-CoA hydratase/carnithine racemase
MSACSSHFTSQSRSGVTLLRLQSADGTNRLTRAGVLALTAAVRELALDPKPLVITGNQKFFSAGADLAEIVALTGPEAYEFSKMGQALMTEIEHFPAPVYAAITGYCMGGGLDLALACHRRIASPQAIFGHRGAALGLITGWGGTQRLPRLIGKAKALEMFIAAEKIHAADALRLGLVHTVAEDPVAEATRELRTKIHPGDTVQKKLRS